MAATGVALASGMTDTSDETEARRARHGALGDFGRAAPIDGRELGVAGSGDLAPAARATAAATG